MATRLCTDFETAVARAYANDTRAGAPSIARALGKPEADVSKVLFGLFNLDRNAARKAVDTGFVREPDPPAAPRQRRGPRTAEPATTTAPAFVAPAAKPVEPAGAAAQTKAMLDAVTTFADQMIAVETAGPTGTEDLEALKTAALAAGQDVAAVASWPETAIDAGREWIADHADATPEPVALEAPAEPPTPVAPEPEPTTAEPEPRPWDLPAIRARQAKTAPEPAGPPNPWPADRVHFDGTWAIIQDDTGRWWRITDSATAAALRQVMALVAEDRTSLLADRDKSRAQLAEAEEAIYDYQAAVRRAEEERDQAQRLAELTAEQEAANAQIIVATRAERDQAEMLVAEYGSTRCPSCGWIGVDGHEHKTRRVAIRVVDLDPAGAP